MKDDRTLRLDAASLGEPHAPPMVARRVPAGPPPPPAAEEPRASFIPPLIEIDDDPLPPPARRASAAAREPAAAGTPPANAAGRMRLGERLVRAGLLAAGDLEAVLNEQRRSGQRTPLGQLLIDKKLVTEAQLYATLAQQYHLPFVDLNQIHIDPAALRLVDPEFLGQHGLLPIDLDGGTLRVATSDPTALHVHDLLRFRVEKKIAEVVVTPGQLAEQFEKHFGFRPDSLGFDRLISELEQQATVDGPEEQVIATELNESDSAVVKLVNQLLADAYHRGASDIHIEPQARRANTRIRLRIDGDCTIYREIPAAFWRAVVSRVKVMAGLDISDRRRPQDGKVRVRVNGRPLELRVATIPTVDDNEDVVLRLLNSAVPLKLSELGMLSRNLDAFNQALQQPHGLVLCVGPTGSGKTTTLHAALATINRPDRKIWTAENPVEITQPGLRQLQIEPKAGITFATALRAFLRADPDVIMIGEMRDLETASIAVDASMTGHLVLSTLHTNSAPETAARILAMGIDAYNFADALLAILAQRLVRRLCPRCRQRRQATREEYDRLAAAFGGEQALHAALSAHGVSELGVGQAVGCVECAQSGYRGRMAVHEVLLADDQLRESIRNRSSAAELREQLLARGMPTLLQDGLLKAMAGETEIRRVLAVCVR